jgi:AbrB family looped-hinge helix DNA binding protein
MRMKVFEKGQVVIPAEIRRRLGIAAGDRLEMTWDAENQALVLRKPKGSEARKLAGSLAAYGEGRGFPSRKEAVRALEKGLGDAASAD